MVIDLEVRIVENGRLSACAAEPPSPQEHEYPPELIEFEVLDPEPVVELPGMQCGRQIMLMHTM
jgi:hypothetical protein